MPQNYRVAYSHEEMNPKRRSTMEDCHRIVESLDSNPLLSYFGVYDGHGGRQIVDFLEESLENNISTELKLNDSADIPERLTRAFLITDMQSRRMDITTSGATAVSALLVANNENSSKTLYVANVGDSRAVLACQSSSSSSSTNSNNTNNIIAKRLSYDHRAEDESEQLRIKNSGGFVTRQRVLGILAVTRAFGDHGMKDFVTANPYVSTSILTNIHDYPFLILACDGVWDVFSDQDACDLILKTLEIAKTQGQGIKEAESQCAQILVQASIDKGSADNITAIVIFLY